MRSSRGRCVWITVLALTAASQSAWAQQPSADRVESPAAHPQQTPPAAAPDEPEPPGADARQDADPSNRVKDRPAPSKGAPLQWNPRWTRFGTGNYILSGVSLAIGFGKFAVGPRESKTYGGVWIDESVRDNLRIDTQRGRRLMRDISDVSLALIETYPFFDALVVAAWYRESPEVGVQMALIGGEVFAVTLALQGIMNIAVSRERPYGRTCGGEVSSDSDQCSSSDRYYSFFSGHSSQSFAAAAVSCQHHLRFPLYGGGTADRLACVAAFGLAATTATLRIAGDMHYFTDVLTGAAVGTLVGFGLPWLLHYRHGDGPEVTNAGLELRLLPMPNGLMAQGKF